MDDLTGKIERDRYVSLAFCWADLLFEIDRQFNIVFASGATEPFLGRSAGSLVGSSFRDLVAPVDMPLVARSLKTILNTGRIKEQVLRVLGPEGAFLWVAMSAYCLDARDGHLFIGLKRSAQPEHAKVSGYRRDETSGLLGCGDFAGLAASRLKQIQAAGESAEVTLLTLPEITQLQERLDAGSCDALKRSVGECLTAHSLGGDAAAQVCEGRFSIVHAAGANIDDLAKQIESLTREADPAGQGLRVESATMHLDADTEMSEQELTKGLLYAMSRFRDGDRRGGSLKELATNLSSLVGEAAVEVSQFKRAVSSGEFHLALQPIVQIHTGEIHHYEALCRFDAKPRESPFESITFAEETGLIHEFDLAMAKKVIEWLSKFPRNNDRYRVAVNVSGFSIAYRCT